ncbi:MAG: hypothetical protein ACHQQR_04750 [Gemmatimonadales bacterium]
MTPLAIGALFAVAAMVWVIAPIFGEKPEAGAWDGARSPDADDAAEAAIRRYREPRE